MNPSFDTYLDIRFVGVNIYELINPLVFDSEKYMIEVKAGFRFDGGSVPKLLQAIECPMAYEMAYASAIHDSLYASHMLPRKEADKVFYNALVAKGMGTIEALAIWKAVRIGGEDHYNSANKIQQNRKFVVVTVKK